MTLEQFFEMHRSPRAIVVRAWDEAAAERAVANDIGEAEGVEGALLRSASKKRSR
jgi:hypothetical protein